MQLPLIPNSAKRFSFTTQAAPRFHYASHFNGNLLCTGRRPSKVHRSPTTISIVDVGTPAILYMLIANITLGVQSTFDRPIRVHKKEIRAGD